MRVRNLAVAEHVRGVDRRRSEGGKQLVEDVAVGKSTLAAIVRTARIQAGKSRLPVWDLVDHPCWSGCDSFRKPLTAIESGAYGSRDGSHRD